MPIITIIDAKTGETTQREMTPKEIAANAPTADQIRSSRDQRLKECDWTQLPDAPVDQAAWAIYRQALRDIPQQDGFPANVIWPIQP